MENVRITKLGGDESGKSTARTIFWELEFGNLVAVECYDWSNEIEETLFWRDNLRISIVQKKLNDWLRTAQ